MNNFFKIKENNTTIPRECIAGITTFFAMSYIIFVNPQLLGLTGMPTGGVFVATIVASIIGTLIMGLFANVPYAQAPGMGLNAFFTFTVCFGLGFTWQEALAMVFLCGLINVVITVTRIRKSIIKAIPSSLQHAMGAGIGLFIAYIGVKNAGLLKFIADGGSYFFTVPDAPEAGVIVNSSIVPSLVEFNNPAVYLSLIGILILTILLVKKVKGAVLISIIATTIIGIPMGITQISNIGATNYGETFSQFTETFGAAFGNPGLMSLFSNTAKIPLVLMTIFAFSLSDTFDTIGTFIGTGRRTKIFDIDDEVKMANTSGFKTKMDKALFADSVATSIGAIFGTSNTTTYVESAAGIEAGGRTGLTSLVTSLCFIVALVAAPFVGIIPPQATAPVLIMVGVMMMAALNDVDWKDLAVAIPAFFAAVFMAYAYSISFGIAFAFIAYIIVESIRGNIKKIHPILWVSAILFIINFILLAKIS